MTAARGHRDAIRALMPAAKADLARLVAFRSVADAALFPIEECAGAARYAAGAFADAGVGDVRLLDMPLGHSAVYGHSPAPAGAPTVLLYSHYDVQPPMDGAAWQTPPFELTERDGRWYGRGAADCKGNLVMLLTALRSFGGRFPAGVKLIVEGSEEQGTGELEGFIPANPELFRADAVLICDTGNFALGRPTITTSLRGVAGVVVRVRTLAGPVHSGMFGGPAPDALVALIAMLATLHDAHGNTTVRGLDNRQHRDGVDYDAAQFRRDANLLDGVDLVGDGSVADLLWARPSVNVIGLDAPRVIGAANALQAEASARVSLRVPPGMNARDAQHALIDHLRAVTPWNVRVEIEAVATGEPFEARTNGPAFQTMALAMAEAYGRDAGTAGQGGSIPLCNVLQTAFPAAEIMLLGVEEPRCLIHAPNESVAPSEIEGMALATSLFLERYGSRKT